MTDPRSADGEPTRSEVSAWNAFVDGLRAAGEQLAANTAGLDEVERADGFRALLRAVANRLASFEVDRERPELVPFNGWRHKFLMDNPDFRYWVADIHDGGRYRIAGNRGDASYVSITVYSQNGMMDVQADVRLDSDSISFDETGGFEVFVGGERPPSGDWLALTEGASVLWVRHFHDDVRNDALGWCEIEPFDAPPAPAPIDPPQFDNQLRGVGGLISALPMIIAATTAAEFQAPNEFRNWTELAGGAVFTEPNIHYVRGSWQLAPGEALLIEGDKVACRYWNILAYSRFLNSLDYRNRPVSYTNTTATDFDGKYRFVLAAEDPGLETADWIDTESRPAGIVMMRFLQAEQPPEPPTVQHVRLSDLKASR
ncbi:DUF1214 domain-containing protein [Mycobacterium sp. 1274756.6]|uniref:DUF1214 domain-containing protein n=1 Tax=Mycobacterium sp. 1274756.6 TaxID=1834076 RepID=UPI0007FE5424|nr:DUF1214 domain-containing protein [Mycobacterium sp. 1274756.6]OBJ68016.1 hypothetical protein A5643_16205 [Mycobacterium sp. 1274756.6]